MPKTIKINFLFWWPYFVLLNVPVLFFLAEASTLSAAQICGVGLLNAMNLALPVLLFIGLEALARRLYPRVGWWVVVFLAALFLLYCHLDYLLFSKVGLHLTMGVRLLLENGLEQSAIMMEASGVRKGQLFFYVRFVLIAVLGVSLALQGFHVLVNRYALPVSRRRLVILAASLGVLLLAHQAHAIHFEQSGVLWTEQKRIGPISFRWPSRPVGIAISGAKLRPLQFRNVSDKHLKSDAYTVNDRKDCPSAENTGTSLNCVVTSNKGNLPDIFVFVIESLRGDIVESNTAPHIFRFASDCLPVTNALAGANATHLSWYSLFTGQHALRAGQAMNKRQPWSSLPLRQLIQHGFHIHAIAGTDLHYYQLDKILFGEHFELVDSLFDERQMDGWDRPKRDREANRRLIEKIDEKKGGRLFLVFFDSTHHDYYWPEDKPPRFQPVAETWNIFDYNISNERLLAIKNRYRNAVYFVDSLVGETIQHLKQTGRYNHSLLFLTGDHGQEFLEHGRLVHANEGCRIQTQVPWLLKLPAGYHHRTNDRQHFPLASHVDFLPTLFDFLELPPIIDFDGISIWRKKKDYAVTAEQNGVRDPYKFCVQSGNLKAWFQYRSNNVYNELENVIYLRKITTPDDRALDSDLGIAEQRQRVGEILTSVDPHMFSQ